MFLIKIYFSYWIMASAVHFLLKLLHLTIISSLNKVRLKTSSKYCHHHSFHKWKIYMVIVAFNLIYFHSSFRTNYYLAMHSLWYMWNVFERRVTCACLHRCLFLFSFYKDMYMRLKYKWTQNGYPLLQCFLFHCTSLTKCLTSDSMADCSLTKYLCCGQI